MIVSPCGTAAPCIAEGMTYAEFLSRLRELTWQWLRERGRADGTLDERVDALGVGRSFLYDFLDKQRDVRLGEGVVLILARIGGDIANALPAAADQRGAADDSVLSLRLQRQFEAMERERAELAELRVRMETVRSVALSHTLELASLLEGATAQPTAEDRANLRAVRELRERKVRALTTASEQLGRPIAEGASPEMVKPLRDEIDDLLKQII